MYSFKCKLMTYFDVKIEFTITVHFFSGGTETTIWKKKIILKDSWDQHQ